MAIKSFSKCEAMNLEEVILRGEYTATNTSAFPTRMVVVSGNENMIGESYNSSAFATRNKSVVIVLETAFKPVAA